MKKFFVFYALVLVSFSNAIQAQIPEGLLYEIIDGRSITITRYIGTDTSVTIPSSIDGLPVTTIRHGAFHNCDSLTNVTIPFSVTARGIESDAFNYCHNLTNISVDTRNSAYMSVDGILFDNNGIVLFRYPAGKSGAYTIPSSVAIIGDYAFYGCTGLTNVTIPSSVVSIGYSAFAYTGLTSITIPSSVTVIDALAFYYCDNLLSVTIPSSVHTIFSLAFEGCKSLTSVTLSRSTLIMNTAFDKGVRIQYRD
jgi:hypothetical protein